MYAVDVGRGQLHWKLRQDSRVTCMEGTNARYLTVADLGESVDLTVIDVAFISVRLILPAILTLVKEEGDVLTLVKPQFEAGRKHVERGGGVIRHQEVHTEVLWNTLTACVTMGWQVKGLCHSPLLGPKGNLEFWLWIQPSHGDGEGLNWDEAACHEVVTRAHGALRQEG